MLTMTKLKVPSNQCIICNYQPNVYCMSQHVNQKHNAHSQHTLHYIATQVLNINTSCPHIPPHYNQLPTQTYILPLPLTAVAHTHTYMYMYTAHMLWYKHNYMVHMHTYVVVFKQEVYMHIYERTCMKTIPHGLYRGGFAPRPLLFSCYSSVHTSKCIKAEKLHH